jgi:phenylacetate-CoA ligase
MNAPLKIAPELRLLAQLEQSQWWSAERLAQAQFRQLDVLLRHARDTVPFYRDRLTGNWNSLPLLTRRNVQDAGDGLRSERVPPEHGRSHVSQTSGSTGQPVKVVGTRHTHIFWRALTLREHFWRRRDLGATLCSIRHDRAGTAKPPHGRVRRGWGPATDALHRGGKMALLALGSDISVQAEWLRRHDPQYLLTFPSNLTALADYFLRNRLALPRLREVRSIGETLTQHAVERVREAWNVPVVDLYSSEEAGVIALQCPSGSGLYHVQSENVLVEVLDDAGRACQPGSVGRVVVSTLNNFAMPLIRYDTGDYAEVGQPCPCGRGLPTLARILGRQRNMLVMPNGDQRWPLTGFMEYRDIAPIRQYQIVQLDRERIEARLVSDRPVTADEERRLTEVMQRWLGHPFAIQFRYLDSFARSASGKFEDFISMVQS